MNNNTSCSIGPDFLKVMQCRISDIKRGCELIFNRYMEYGLVYRINPKYTDNQSLPSFIMSIDTWNSRFICQDYGDNELNNWVIGWDR